MKIINPFEQPLRLMDPINAGIINPYRACDTIDRGSTATCPPPPGGTRARLILINLTDIQADPAGFSETANEEISGIFLNSGAYAYAFTGFRNGVKKSEEVIKQELGMSLFKHMCSFVIHERTQEQKNNIEKICRGKFVAILENNGKDATSFELYGKEVGLQIVAGPIRNAHENGGFFVLNLSTPDDEGQLEPKLPQTIAIGDPATYITTAAAIDALVAS